MLPAKLKSHLDNIQANIKYYKEEAEYYSDTGEYGIANDYKNHLYELRKELQQIISQLPKEED